MQRFLHRAFVLYALSIFLFLTPVSVLAAPAAAAYCLNPSNIWIPVAMAATGTAYPGTPPPYALYGNYNSGTVWYPLACDANGNLIVTGTGGTPVSLQNGSTAVTQPMPYDFSTLISTDAFVVTLVDLQMGTAPIGSVTGGTYSFNSACTGVHLLYNGSGGAVSSINTWLAGSGCQAGDVVTVNAGNYDSLLQITAVTSGTPTAGTILYGGTGYPAGLSSSTTSTGANAVQFTFLLSGTLTSNATFVMPYGSYITTSNQWFWANNTTGAFTVTVCQATSAGANTCGAGTSVVLPQGTGNNSTVLLSTDGVLNVWVPSTFTPPVNAPGFRSQGTIFSVTGCGTATSLVGGSTAGKFVAAQTACTPVVTTNLTAPNGYSCWMNDRTTTTVKFQETASTQTTVTFTATGTLGGTDTIDFGCLEY
jgi:hypothetical protein